MIEKMNNIPNEAPPVINNLTPDDIPRCPNCNLICSLILNYKDGIPYINFECENKHKGNISLEEYMKKYNKFALSKEKCQECYKTQKDVKGDFSYCSKCAKFLCHECVINHPNGDKHNIVNFKRYDSLCKIHSNTFCFYCVKCKQNLCIYCQSKHESHDLINLSKFNYSDKSKKKLEEEIKSLDLRIKNLEIIKQNIILLVDTLRELNELEMKFIETLLYTYQYEEIQNNLNFNIIQNLKNLENTFTINKIELYEKVYKESNKYISFLQNLQINKSNCFKNNFKILKDHTNYISYLSILKDGRLVSSSCDCTLNIYKIDSFELQLSIKEHSGTVRSFIQLNNENIITCSDDQTMKIIKLIGEDNYKIEQTLQDHTSYVWNVLEIKENELISVSLDNTMKIWKLNDENKFVCINTIIFQNSNGYCNILQLNENKFVTSSYSDKCVKFWENYSNIVTIDNIETEWTFKTMCLLNKNVLCIGGTHSKGFYLIDIINYQIIKNIFGPKIIYSIHKCFDGLILCSIVDENKNHCLVKYKYDENDLKKVVEKKNAHNNFIYSCIELNDGIIASGGRDCLIKLWNKD